MTFKGVSVTRPFLAVAFAGVEYEDEGRKRVSWFPFIEFAVVVAASLDASAEVCVPHSVTAEPFRRLQPTLAEMRWSTDS